MNDLEDIHAIEASRLINNFQDQASSILKESAAAFAAAMKALNDAHTAFMTELGALGAATAAQIGNRLDTTRTLQEDLIHHFMGTAPIKEPTIRIVTRKPELPQIIDAPLLTPQLTDETVHTEAAE